MRPEFNPGSRFRLITFPYLSTTGQVKSGLRFSYEGAVSYGVTVLDDGCYWSRDGVASPLLSTHRDIIRHFREELLDDAAFQRAAA